MLVSERSRPEGLLSCIYAGASDFVLIPEGGILGRDGVDDNARAELGPSPAVSAGFDFHHEVMILVRDGFLQDVVKAQPHTIELSGDFFENNRE